jgi:hypothetical protein
MKFKNIGLVSLLLLSSILLFSWCNKNKQQEPEENYFTAVIDENWILNVIDGWNSKLIKWAKIELDGENDYKIWDTVTIYFEWEIEDIDKINHKLVPWKLWIQVRTVSNWNVILNKSDNNRHIQFTLNGVWIIYYLCKYTFVTVFLSLFLLNMECLIFYVNGALSI